MWSEHGRRLRLASGCCRKLYRRRYEAELCSGRMCHIHAHPAVLDSGSSNTRSNVLIGPQGTWEASRSCSQCSVECVKINVASFSF